MSKSIIDPDFFLARMKEELQRDMIAAAEPLILATMIQLEKKVRETIAKAVLIQVNSSYEAHRNENFLHIKVKLDVGNN